MAAPRRAHIPCMSGCPSGVRAGVHFAGLWSWAWSAGRLPVARMLATAMCNSVRLITGLLRRFSRLRAVALALRVSRLRAVALALRVGLAFASLMVWLLQASRYRISDPECTVRTLIPGS